MVVGGLLQGKIFRTRPSSLLFFVALNLFFNNPSLGASPLPILFTVYRIVLVMNMPVILQTVARLHSGTVIEN